MERKRLRVLGHLPLCLGCALERVSGPLSCSAFPVDYTTGITALSTCKLGCLPPPKLYPGHSYVRLFYSSVFLIP